MKKLFFLLIIIPFALNSMESNFESFKTAVETSVAECENITNNSERFKTWQTKYEELLKQLPNNQEEIDTFLQTVADESYENPVLNFLLHTKRKKVQATNNTLFSKWFKKIDTKNIELVSAPITLATEKQFQDWVAQAAQNYNLLLPHTEFGQQLWKEGVLGEKCTGSFTHLPNDTNTVIGAGTQIASKLSKLDLNCLHFLLKYLNILDLRDNNLTDLPQNLSALKNLKILVLGYNKFTQLPEVIKSFISLEFLVANNNQLNSDPTEIITLLTQLKYLDFSSNKLTNFDLQALPESVKSLRLDDNQLTTLDSICPNSQLEYIALNTNPLTEMPYNELFGLKYLKAFTDTQGRTIRIEPPQKIS